MGMLQGDICEVQFAALEFSSKQNVVFQWVVRF